MTLSSLTTQPFMPFNIFLFTSTSVDGVSVSGDKDSPKLFSPYLSTMISTLSAMFSISFFYFTIAQKLEGIRVDLSD